VLNASFCRIVTVVIAVSLVACANPEIVEVSPGTYLLARTDRAGMFGNASAMKVDVIREANEFAASKGKVVVLLSLRETPMRVGQYASIEYQFRLADTDDPQATSGTSLSPHISTLPSTDVVIETTDKLSTENHAEGDIDKSKDVYDELIKLDDLRKRGILTDEEFDAEKKELLDGN
jgi:hypothetical protein